MSDWIEHDGKKYFAEEYLTLANKNAERMAAHVAEVEAARPRLVDYYTRQIEWSRRTFGESPRTKGIVEHIRKELHEVLLDPHDLTEWIDVMILAMDGFWRHGGTPANLMEHLEAKQRKNFARAWPRPTSDDAAVEHVRDAERIPAWDHGATPAARQQS